MNVGPQVKQNNFAFFDVSCFFSTPCGAWRIDFVIEFDEPAKFQNHEGVRRLVGLAST